VDEELELLVLVEVGGVGLLLDHLPARERDGALAPLALAL
jgi:hypothetical protein